MCSVRLFSFTNAIQLLKALLLFLPKLVFFSYPIQQHNLLSESFIVLLTTPPLNTQLISANARVYAFIANSGFLYVDEKGILAACSSNTSE